MQNISIHSLFELSYVNHPLISPDGELVAFGEPLFRYRPC